MADQNPYHDILNAPSPSRRRITESVYDQKYESKLRQVGDAGPSRRRRKRIALYQAIIGTGHGAILEIGCGVGDLTYALVDQAERIVGVDISAKALDFARARSGSESLGHDRGRKIEFVQMSAVELDFRDETFDWALSTSMIEHLHPDDVDSHLAEVSRVLKREGKYLIWCPNALGHHKDREGHLSMLSYDGWIRKLSAAGFVRFYSTLTTRPPMVNARFKVSIERTLSFLKIKTLWSHLGVRNVLLVAMK